MQQIFKKIFNIIKIVISYILMGIIYLIMAVLLTAFSAVFVPLVFLLEFTVAFWLEDCG